MFVLVNVFHGLKLEVMYPIFFKIFKGGHKNYLGLKLIGNNQLFIYADEI